MLFILQKALFPTNSDVCDITFHTLIILNNQLVKYVVLVSDLCFINLESHQFLSRLFYINLYALFSLTKMMTHKNTILFVSNISR